MCGLTQETVTIRIPIANSKLNPPYEMKDFKLLEPFSVVKYMFCEAGVAVDYDAVKLLNNFGYTIGKLVRRGLQKQRQRSGISPWVCMEMVLN